MDSVLTTFLQEPWWLGFNYLHCYCAFFIRIIIINNLPTGTAPFARSFPFCTLVIYIHEEYRKKFDLYVCTTCSLPCALDYKEVRKRWMPTAQMNGWLYEHGMVQRQCKYDVQCPPTLSLIDSRLKVSRNYRSGSSFKEVPQKQRGP